MIFGLAPVTEPTRKAKARGVTYTQPASHFRTLHKRGVSAGACQTTQNVFGPAVLTLAKTRSMSVARNAGVHSPGTPARSLIKALPSRRKDLEPVSPLRFTASFLRKCTDKSGVQLKGLQGINSVIHTRPPPHVSVTVFADSRLYHGLTPLRTRFRC